MSPDAQLRDSSSEALEIFASFEAESGSRKDLYQLLQAVKVSDQILDPESQLWLDQQLLSFTRNGVHLFEETRNRLVEIKRDLSHISREFELNLARNADELSFTREELTGVPENSTTNLQQCSTTDKLAVRLRPMSLGPLLRYASRSSTRRRLVIANWNRCKENVPLLQKAIVLRDEAARLLGYSNHAEYKSEITMERSISVVRDLLDGLQARLAPRREAELATVRDLKLRDLLQNGESDDGNFYVWDYAYYSRLFDEQRSRVDEEVIAEYFPLDTTIDRMLGIFAQLFAMSFVHVEGESLLSLAELAGGRLLAWHKDVRLYEVWDRSNGGSEDQGNDAFLGHLYMDLHPREGKFGHVADFAVRPVSHYLSGYAKIRASNFNRASRMRMAVAAIQQQLSSVTSRKRRRKGQVCSSTVRSCCCFTNWDMVFTIWFRELRTLVFMDQLSSHPFRKLLRRCWRIGAGRPRSCALSVSTTPRSRQHT